MIEYIRKIFRPTYLYFVSYSYVIKSGGFGTGNVQLVLPGKVKSISDIKEMKNIIENEFNMDDPVVIFYKLLNWMGARNETLHY